MADLNVQAFSTESDEPHIWSVGQFTAIVPAIQAAKKASLEEGTVTKIVETVWTAAGKEVTVVAMYLDGERIFRFPNSEVPQ